MFQYGVQKRLTYNMSVLSPIDLTYLLQIQSALSLMDRTYKLALIRNNYQLLKEHIISYVPGKLSVFLIEQ